MDDGVLVSDETARAAQSFLDALPADRELPKVAPDGEGGLYMAWERIGEATVVIGVIGLLLYAVVGPGTPRSRHIPETAFDGTSIPMEILGEIPK